MKDLIADIHEFVERLYNQNSDIFFTVTDIDCIFDVYLLGIRKIATQEEKLQAKMKFYDLDEFDMINLEVLISKIGDND